MNKISTVGFALALVPHNDSWQQQQKCIQQLSFNYFFGLSPAQGTSKWICSLETQHSFYQSLNTYFLPIHSITGRVKSNLSEIYSYLLLAGLQLSQQLWDKCSQLRVQSVEFLYHSSVVLRSLVSRRGWQLDFRLFWHQQAQQWVCLLHCPVT